MGKKSKVPGGAAYNKQTKALTKLAKKTSEFAMSQAKGVTQTANEQLALARDDYVDSKEIAGRIGSKLEGLADDNSEWARADRARHESVFQPLEDDLVAEAWDYRSDARRDLEMGRAQADVAQKLDQQREAATRDLEGYGIDPSSTRYAALDLDFRTKRAAAQAAAANQARLQTENTGRQLRSDAISLGLKYPEFADKASDNALASDIAAVGVRNDTVKTGYNTMGTGVEYGGLGVGYTNAATGAVSAAGQITNAARANTIDQYKAEEASNTNWGEAAGLIAGAATKAYFGAEGGAIPDPEAGVASQGGAIPMEASASGGEEIDDVDAKLTAGEFVIPVDVVKWKGEEFFQKLIEQARTKQGDAKAQPEEKMTTQGPPTFQSSAIPA